MVLTVVIAAMVGTILVLAVLRMEDEQQENWVLGGLWMLALTVAIIFRSLPVVGVSAVAAVFVLTVFLIRVVRPDNRKEFPVGWREMQRLSFDLGREQSPDELDDSNRALGDLARRQMHINGPRPR